MIIRGVTDKPSSVHVSRLAQALSSMTCVLGVHPEAAGYIFNVTDNKPKKGITAVLARHHQHSANPEVSQALNRNSCCYRVRLAARIC